ncbi:hypothetical protein, partial [Pseudomonas fragi]|uniref:hypothetical protein n=1 Tax=Pseudomonas fragi TaxID=296 RepID=UPI001EEE01BE
MIAQLATEFMANLAPQVDIRDGQNVNSNNDEFQEYRHKSGETQPGKHASGPISRKKYRVLVPLFGSQYVRLKQHFGHFPAFHNVFVIFAYSLWSCCGCRPGMEKAASGLV